MAGWAAWLAGRPGLGLLGGNARVEARRADVFQTMYGATGERLATLLRDVITLPGAQVIDDCPWKRVLEVWPHPLPSLADAAILAVAVTNRYDAVATFDRKLARRVREAGIRTYW